MTKTMFVNPTSQEVDRINVQDNSVQSAQIIINQHQNNTTLAEQEAYNQAAQEALFKVTEGMTKANAVFEKKSKDFHKSTRSLGYVVAATKGIMSTISSKLPLDLPLELAGEYVDNMMEDGATIFNEHLITEYEGVVQQLVNENILTNPALSDEQKATLIKDGILKYTGISGPRATLTSKIGTKLSLDYVAKNGERINDLINRVDTIEVDMDQLKQSLEKDIEKLEYTVALEFRNISGALSELYENDKIIFSTLEDINKRVETNTQRIEENAKKISVNTQNIGINRENILQNRALISHNNLLIKQNQEDIGTIQGYLYGTLDVNSKLQALKTGDLGDLGLTAVQRDKRIGELETLVKVESITSMANTISSAVSGGMRIFDALGLFKSPSGQKVAKTIGKVLDIGMGIASVVTATMAGGPIGFISSIGGLLGSLFGSKKPQKSAELQAIENVDRKLDDLYKLNEAGFKAVLDSISGIYNQLGYMDQKIDTHFDNVYKNFDFLNKQIHNLQYQIRDFEARMMAANKTILSKLEVLNTKINDVQETATQILYKDFDTCKSIVEFSITDQTNLTTLNQILRDTSALDCVKGVIDFIRISNPATFKLSKMSSAEAGDFIDHQINTVYTPLLDFVHYFFSNERNPYFIARPCQVYPATEADLIETYARKEGFGDAIGAYKTIHGNLKRNVNVPPNILMYAIKEMDIAKYFSLLNEPLEAEQLTEWQAQRFDTFFKGREKSLRDLLGPLLSPYSIYQLAKEYLKYFVFIELLKEDKDELVNLEDILSGNHTSPYKKKTLQRDLDFLMDLLDIAIAQQSLLAGVLILPMLNYYRLHRHQFSKFQHTVRDLVLPNPTLKRNFELYLNHYYFNPVHNEKAVLFLDQIDQINNREEPFRYKAAQNRFPELFEYLASVDLGTLEDCEEQFATQKFIPRAPNDQPFSKVIAIHLSEEEDPKAVKIVGIGIKLVWFDAVEDYKAIFAKAVQGLTEENEKRRAIRMTGRKLFRAWKKQNYKNEYDWTYFSKEDILQPTIAMDPIVDTLTNLKTLVFQKKMELEVNQELKNQGLEDADLTKVYTLHKLNVLTDGEA